MNADDAFIQAQTKVHEALQAMADVWGPRLCDHGSYSDCEVCDFSETRPAPNAMLSEFVLVANWTEMETGDTHVTFMTPPNQLVSHTNGILFGALYQ